LIDPRFFLNGESEANHTVNFITYVTTYIRLVKFTTAVILHRLNKGILFRQHLYVKTTLMDVLDQLQISTYLTLKMSNFFLLPFNKLVKENSYNITNINNCKLRTLSLDSTNTYYSGYKGYRFTSKNVNLTKINQWLNIK